MRLNDHHVFHWFTTPQELREIADRMQERWRSIKPGHDKTIHTVTGRTSRLDIIIDQEYMAAEESDKPPTK